MDPGQEVNIIKKIFTLQQLVISNILRNTLSKLTVYIADKYLSLKLRNIRFHTCTKNRRPTKNVV